MPADAHTARFLKSPLRTFFSLWVPVLFSLVAEPVTGLVDTAFVARLGADSLASLGVGTMVLSSVFWIFNFLSVGSQTEVSQALGRRDMARGVRMGSLAMFLALCAGLALTLLAWVFAAPVATAMGAAGAVHRQAVVYIQWRAVGAPAVLLTLTAFGILYGLQEMRLPLWIAVGVNAMNILLDGILIFGWGPVPAMGIAGAAAASALSQWIGAGWAAYRVYRRLGFTRRIQIIDVRRLLRVGADMFVRTGMLTVFLLLATRAATRLGPEAGAAHQAIRQVWVFTALFLDASAITAQSLIGWFVGSGQVAEARKVAGFVCLWSTMVGTMLAAAMLGGRHLIADTLVPPSARALFFPAWMAAALTQPIGALAFVTDGIHWGTGDFRYLRNVVVLATACGALGIWMLGGGSPDLLTGIWWVTGAWISIRTCFGLLRIWPAIGKSPLKG
ncbi:MATE family efflux transporter [Desulfosarcina alkanivorans]|jgi:MATE family multidrug resistance protein|uniref:MATE family efflux transporter n=1 Tax=Desulfosarcina alkanivorans TaxID=571177 RepID=A0A5K7YPS8_9BACT|nr:MATE family efflux transporter [Desulfosarcina alkanivorans]BBO70355.1 MATE family efflux transporter [Desulfosarcina alkanivorans]